LAHDIVHRATLPLFTFAESINQALAPQNIGRKKATQDTGFDADFHSKSKLKKSENYISCREHIYATDYLK
jgi:hypothetical protein